MSGEISFDELDDLVDSLKAAGVRTVTTDPDDLANKLPAVWVQPTGINLDLLGGYTITCRVVLIAPKSGRSRHLPVLAGLLNQVLTVLDPDDTVTTAIYRPSTGGPDLPALAVPYSLHIEF